VDWIGWLTVSGACVAAIGSCGALLVAALVYRRQQADRHREHAAQISVWRAWIGTKATSLSGKRPAVVPTSAGARLRNSSKEPVYAVIVFFTDELGNSLTATRPIDVLPPEYTADITSPEIVEALRVAGLAGSDAYAVGVSFLDRAGVRWSRDYRGQLTEMGTALDQPLPT
jgi:hypothetical protein